eukprot:g29435.t1
MCFVCDGSPGAEGDPYPEGAAFKTDLMHSWCKDPICFLCNWLCPPCTQFILRRKALAEDMSKYRCCQGYFECCCIKPGDWPVQSCPELCLCIEVCCCPGLALSATRMWMLSCIFQCIYMLTGQCEQAAEALRIFASIVWCIVSGCMTAQTNYEIEQNKAMGGILTPGGAAPAKQTMT